MSFLCRLMVFPLVLAINLFMAAGPLSAQGAMESRKDVIINELSIRDMDITNALALIAQKSGLNIITGRGVEGRVTVFLRHVPAKEALSTVLEANGLAFADEGGIIRVMTGADFLARYGHAFGQEKVTKVMKLNFVPVTSLVPLLEEMKSPDGKVIPNESAKTVMLVDNAEKVRVMEGMVREMDVQTVTTVIPLKYIRAENILEEVRGMVTQSVGGVECDVEGNRLIVTDTLVNMEQIKKTVDVLDARGRKIILQARLVHIVLNDEHLRGVDWGGIASDVQNLRLEGAYDFLDRAGKANVLSLGTIAEAEFSMLVDALDTVGIVKEYPVSDVAIAPDDEARIVVKLDEPYLTLNAVRVSEAPFLGEPFKGDGASLEFLVKPVVDADGSLRTLIVPHEKGVRYQSRGATVRSEADGMIILGNLIATEKVLTARRVPVVGAIPILGFAFRYHNASVRREEFVVFLTPKIMPREEDAVSTAPAAVAPATIAESSDLSVTSQEAN